MGTLEACQLQSCTAHAFRHSCYCSLPPATVQQMYMFKQAACIAALLSCRLSRLTCCLVETHWQ
jgi:hypothetical protein